ncbi:FAD dependent oxidoreductase [Achaetomium macrosporum]|uniref:FAD dependent oxidoreductase n=1 Tax=Achaetomium macrosporum TaxID=79813 RepID=A0AAN7C5Y3_9PEZI|nr:FAD dependent oxidoreductase [Achaetomium macrosporum]
MSSAPIIGQLPVPLPTRSCWQSEQSNGLDNHQGIEHLPAYCDILIIGGGYAGVATAYHLLKKSAAAGQDKPRVLLLEAREACSGATGRNGGHLRPDITNMPVLLSERYGSQAAAAVAQFEMDHLGAIARLVEEEDLECSLTEAASFEVFTTPEQVVAAQKRLDTLRAQPAFAGLLAEAAVEFHSGEDAPARTGVKDAKAWFSSRAAHLSPYQLTLGLLARALELGLCLKTHTPVLSIFEADADGVGKARKEGNGTGEGSSSRAKKCKYRIKTPQGDVTAAKVVVATNAYTSALLPEYAPAIVPCRGLACRISSPTPLPSLPTSSLCTRVQGQGGDLSPGYNYIIQRGDGTLVVGGAHHTYKQQDLASWYGNADDAGVIEPARSYYCDCDPSESGSSGGGGGGFAARTFVGWDEVPTRVDHVWTGIMGYSADSLPHVGPVPGRGDGVFILAGFHGHGMPVAYLAAKGVAEMVSEGKTYEQTGLPALYRASQQRLVPRYDDILGGRKRQTNGSKTEPQ